MTSREYFKEYLDLASFEICAMVDALHHMDEKEADKLSKEFKEVMQYVPSVEKLGDDFMEFTQRARDILDQKGEER